MRTISFRHRHNNININYRFKRRRKNILYTMSYPPHDLFVSRTRAYCMRCLLLQDDAILAHTYSESDGVVVTTQTQRGVWITAFVLHRHFDKCQFPAESIVGSITCYQRSHYLIPRARAIESLRIELSK